MYPIRCNARAVSVLKAPGSCCSSSGSHCMCVRGASTDHGQRARDGNRGIHGITAGPQDADAGLVSVVVRRGNHRVTRRRAG
ncbi:MAG: hypothetical protein WB526_06015 [Candidatus Cybelea sp.]